VASGTILVVDDDRNITDLLSLYLTKEGYSVMQAAGQAVGTTPRETELLWFLAAHPDQVFSRDRLLREVWGYDYTGDARTVDTHIKRLRQKLGQAVSRSEAGVDWEIATVWGVGYKFRRGR